MSRHLIHMRRGFTLIELVVIMVILGVLAAVAVPVFFDVRTYQERAAFDEVAGAVRYAQKLAVASGCDIQVSIENNEYQLWRKDPCDNTGNFTPLDSNFPIFKGPDEKVKLTPTSAVFYFDNMGRSSVPIEIEVGELVPPQKIEIHAETGYVDVDAQ